MDKNYLLDKYLHDKAESDAYFAEKQRSEGADKSRKILKDYLDKIMFYSAGSFSFLVALIQLVEDKHLLSVKGLFNIPNVYLMYISMGLFILTITLSLLSRRFDAYYISYETTKFFCNRKLKERKAMLVLYQKYPEMGMGVEDIDSEIRSVEKDIKVLESSLEENGGKSKVWLRLMQWLGYFAELLAVFATVVMFLFSIQLSQSVVW